MLVSVQNTDVPDLNPGWNMLTLAPCGEENWELSAHGSRAQCGLRRLWVSGNVAGIGVPTLNLALLASA